MAKKDEKTPKDSKGKKVPPKGGKPKKEKKPVEMHIDEEQFVSTDDDDEMVDPRLDAEEDAEEVVENSLDVEEVVENSLDAEEDAEEVQITDTSDEVYTPGHKNDYERTTLRWEEIQKSDRFINHRREMKNISELGNSLTETGLQNPIMVWAVPCDPILMPWGDTSTEEYFLIAGFRRYAAIEQIRAENGSGHFDTVPVNVFRGSLTEALLVSLTENIQREDPNPLDLGRVFHHLHENEGITLTEIAGRIGKKRPWVSFIMTLYRGDDKVSKELVTAVQDGIINHWVAVKVARHPIPYQVDVVRRLRSALKEGNHKAEASKVRSEVDKKAKPKRAIRSASEVREMLEKYIEMPKKDLDPAVQTYLSGLMKGFYWSLNNDPDMSEMDISKWLAGYEVV